MTPPRVVTKEPVELMEYANVMQEKLEMIVLRVSQFTTKIKSRFNCTLIQISIYCSMEIFDGISRGSLPPIGMSK